MLPVNRPVIHQPHFDTVKISEFGVLQKPGWIHLSQLLAENGDHFAFLAQLLASIRPEIEIQNQYEFLSCPRYTFGQFFSCQIEVFTATLRYTN